MKTLALITARGGSKGIPGKNIKPLAGKPLITWTIEAALSSCLRDSVVVSTDDVRIAEVAQQAGALVPFMRPAALASDTAPAVDVVLHALQQLPQFDSVLLLQPTSPLRSSEDIDACLALARERCAPSVVSVCESSTHPAWTYWLSEDNRLDPVLREPLRSRRQDLPPAYSVNGALYFAHADWLKHRRRLIADETVAYEMPAERSIDIDTMLDWRLAEVVIADFK
jgi:CMP-N,N'-diacetyllegionaminic acid synthase